MGANLDLIRATYEGSSEDNGRNLLAALAPDAMWTEAEGFPYAGTYVGPDAIVAGVFNRLGTEWIGYNAKSIPLWRTAIVLRRSVSTPAPTKRRASR